MNTKEASLQPNSLHFAVVRRVKGIYDEGMEDVGRLKNIINSKGTFVLFWYPLDMPRQKDCKTCTRM